MLAQEIQPLIFFHIKKGCIFWCVFTVCVENMDLQGKQVLIQNPDGDELVQSSLVSRNITILGRRTSVRLEPEMWLALRDISKREKCNMHEICSLIYARKQPNTSLTAAIRVFLMLYYRSAATEEGHARAGHGDFSAMRRRARFTPEDEINLKNGALLVKDKAEARGS